MKRKFRLGQKVRIRQWDDMVEEFGADADENIRSYFPFNLQMSSLCGKVATICKLDNNRVFLCMFEDCYDIKTRWNYSIDMIESIEKPDTIVIYRNGKETVALLKDGKTVVKTATAKCCPTDTYDFEAGAKLAFSRLMEDEEIEKQDDRSDFKFKVGDAVVITNKGEVYTKYREFVERYATCYQDRFIEQGRPNCHEGFRIVGEGLYHHNLHQKLYVIQNTTTLQVFVIGSSGLKRV